MWRREIFLFFLKRLCFAAAPWRRKTTADKWLTVESTTSIERTCCFAQVVKNSQNVCFDLCGWRGWILLFKVFFFLINGVCSENPLRLVSPLSEPLYQTYRDSVITKEIRRQTVCRNISKTSADYPMDWPPGRPRAGTGTGTGTGTGNGGPRSSPVPTPGQSTLWQDLPAVRDSGVLEQLTTEQCKYQEVRPRSRNPEIDDGETRHGVSNSDIAIMWWFWYELRPTPSITQMLERTIVLIDSAACERFSSHSSNFPTSVCIRAIMESLQISYYLSFFPTINQNFWNRIPRSSNLGYLISDESLDSSHFY